MFIEVLSLRLPARPGRDCPNGPDRQDNMNAQNKETGTLRPKTRILIHRKRAWRFSRNYQTAHKSNIPL